MHLAEINLPLSPLTVNPFMSKRLFVINIKYIVAKLKNLNETENSVRLFQLFIITAYTNISLDSPFCKYFKCTIYYRFIIYIIPFLTTQY